MTLSRRGFLRAATVVGTAAAGGVAAAGCTLTEHGGSAGDPPGSGGTSPFTGEEAESGPVLAVKVDNAAHGRPVSGLEQAELVYVLPVEGGVSRFLAIFSAALPETVGPVRSLRESDLPLLRQFTSPGVACSGAHEELLPELERAPVVPVTPGTAGAAYHRDEQRQAPYNLYLDAAAGLDAVPEPGNPSDIGFRFAAAPGGGEPATSLSEGYGAFHISVDWSEGEQRWMISLDGASAETTAGTQLSAATVVFQEVEPGQTALGDPETPYVESIGSGPARVLRDGRLFTGTWERGGENSGTTFLDSSGDTIPFATGPVWVVPLPAGGSW